MNTPEKKNLWRWLPGIIISLVAIALLSHAVSWEDVVASLKVFKPIIFLPVLLVYLISMFSRVACWFWLLQRKVPFTRVMFALNEGYLINNVLPIRMGELGRAALLGKSSDLGFFHVFSTIVMERAFDLVIAAGLLLSTLPLVLEMSWARPMAFGVLAVVGCGLVGVYFAARHRTSVYDFFHRLGERWGVFRTPLRWGLPKLQSMLDGFSVLNHPRVFIISFLFLASSWGLAMVQDYILLRTVAPSTQFWWIGFVLSVSALGAAIPSAPSALGVFEASVVGALSLLGVGVGAALAYAIVIHVIQIGISSTIGLVGLSQEGESLSKIFQDLNLRK